MICSDGEIGLWSANVGRIVPGLHSQIVRGAETPVCFGIFFFFSSRRRHTRSVSAFLLNRSSDLKALNLRKTLLMASSVRLKPLNCSRLPCVYAQETLTFLLTQKKTCVKNYVQKE